MSKAKVELVGSEVRELLHEGDFNILECCGVIEFQGMGWIDSPSKAKAIRRAAAIDSDEDDEWGRKGSGYVLATTVDGPKQIKQDSHLRAAGFKLIRSFINGRTGNEIHLWGATTLRSGPTGDEEVAKPVAYAPTEPFRLNARIYGIGS